MLILVFFSDTVYQTCFLSHMGSRFFLHIIKISVVNSEIYFTKPHTVDERDHEKTVNILQLSYPVYAEHFICFNNTTE